MLDWVYNVPAALAVGVIALIFVAICWGGIVALRPLVKFLVHREPGLNEIIGDFLQYFGVIYGLLLGLLAVATYQNLAEVDKTVGHEAAALGALYRDVSAYPEPIRSELQDEIRHYTRFVIDEAWPLQRKGIVPAGAVTKAARIHESLAGFEPQSKSQEAMHAVALRQFNTFYEYRRERLYSVTSQRDLGDSARPLVYGRDWSAVEYAAAVAVRSPPRTSLVAWRHIVLLPRNHDLADLDDGPAFPR